MAIRIRKAVTLVSHGALLNNEYNIYYISFKDDRCMGRILIKKTTLIKFQIVHLSFLKKKKIMLCGGTRLQTQLLWGIH